MVNFFFLVSHLHSGSQDFADILNQNPRIVLHKSMQTYRHPTDLDPILNAPHKINNAAAMYGDHLLYNHHFCCRELSHCKFIYVVRSATETINELIRSKSYDFNTAGKYYSFRIRRIYEMAKKTPGAVFLTYDQLKYNKWEGLVENYLNLKQKLEWSDKFVYHNLELASREECRPLQDCYEKYLYYIRKLPLQFSSKE